MAKPQHDAWNIKTLPAASVTYAQMAKDVPKALENLERLQGHLKVPEYNKLLEALGFDECIAKGSI